MLRSIRWKLAICFLLVVVVSVGLTAFLISITAQREFRQYISNCDNAYTNSVSNFLSGFYRANHGWANVQNLLDEQVQSNNERLVLTDIDGLVIADTNKEWVGKNIKDTSLTEFVLIQNSDKNIGRLYPVGCDCNSAVSLMSRSCSGNIIYTTTEQTYINGINNYLWMVGLIAAAIALFLSLILTRQITFPIHSLKKGAQKLSSGDLKHRVKVNTGDELGDLAQSFNSMANSLDKIEQSRRHLTADIAHELRTPLTVIEGTVDGMLDGVFTPDQEHLGWIKEQTILLTRLIDDLRDISLAESGQLKLNLMSVDLVELIDRKISQISIKAREKGISLQLNASNIPDIILDPVRIEQVVNNLLSNALRHTSSGGKIIVSVEDLSNQNNYFNGKSGILVSLADDGEGIPEEHLSNVFERFYRVESSRTKEEGETGLGLAIVKQMVEAHRGKVWAESKPGKGSVFYFCIPRE